HGIIAIEHWRQLETNEEFKRYLVEPVAAEMKSQEYQWRTINPNSKDGRRQPQDELEVELLARWKYLDQQPTEEGDSKAPPSFQRHLPEQHEYQYYQPIYTKSTCVQCHRIIESNDDLLE